MLRWFRPDGIVLICLVCSVLVRWLSYRVRTSSGLPMTCLLSVTCASLVCDIRRLWTLLFLLGRLAMTVSLLGRLAMLMKVHRHLVVTFGAGQRRRVVNTVFKAMLVLLLVLCCVADLGALFVLTCLVMGLSS